MSIKGIFLKSFFLYFFFSFIFISKVSAAFSFSVTEVSPISVDSKNQEIQIKISVNSLPSGDSYFRIGIDNGVSSIGYLKNNINNWIKLGTLASDKENNQCANYFKISTDDDYLLTIKIGEDNEILNGSHALKAYRFTSTCGSYSNSSESPNLAINVNLPAPSPTSTPTEEPTSIPTPTPTSTPTLKPTVIPTSTPTPKPTLKPTPSSSAGGFGVSPTPTIESGENILGTETEITPFEENNSGNSQKETNSKGISPDIIAKILIFSGLIFLAVPAFFLLRPLISGYTDRNG